MKTKLPSLLLIIGLLFTEASLTQIAVEAQRAKGFSIFGEVHIPNKFAWHEGMTLLRALVWVQGFTPQAVLTEAVICRQADQGEVKVVEVNLAALMKGHADDVRLEADDIVIVPSYENVFFVAGETIAPGKFELKNGMGLRQAISLARGVTFNAALRQTRVYRQGDNGKRNMLKVDLSAVMNGKQDDLPILSGDVIIVPRLRRTAN